MKLSRKLSQRLLPCLVFLGFLGLWELAIYLGSIPIYILPGPVNIISVLFERLPDLFAATWITAQEAVGGFLLSFALGLTLSLIFAISPIIRQTLLPYIVLLQTIPIIAVSPLIIIWLGNNMWAVLAIATIVCLPPVTANITQGLVSVEGNLLDLFRMGGASTWMVLAKLRLPHALPSIFVALRISSGLAVVGALVGETFAGSSSVGQGGLGYTSIYAVYQTQIPYLFALVLFSSAMGLLFFSLVQLAEWYFLHNWHSSLDEAASH